MIDLIYFGNSTIDQVHPCLLSVLDDLGRGDIPAYRGAPRPLDAAELRDSDAARFLAETVPEAALYALYAGRPPAASSGSDAPRYWETLFYGWRRAGEAQPQ